MRTAKKSRTIPEKSAIWKMYSERRNISVITVSGGKPEKCWISGVNALQRNGAPAVMPTVASSRRTSGNCMTEESGFAFAAFSDLGSPRKTAPIALVKTPAAIPPIRASAITVKTEAAKTAPRWVMIPANAAI